MKAAVNKRRSNMTASISERFRNQRLEERDDLLEWIYKTGPNEYYYRDPDEAQFERSSKKELKEKLEALGAPSYLDRIFGDKDSKDRRLESDRFFEELFSEVKTLDYAGPLAGYEAGFREYNGTKILVTRGNWTCLHDELEEGDWSGLRGILERMWGPEQIHYLYSWMQRVIQAMQSRSPIPIQFFAFGGPPDSGKTW
jgi:hypothetical protein